ncbi:CBS domain-containing protein [Streptomyces johnsoniae]|uniref:CBS domain-containing protein n=1 Tax=Streptomyces johnsoniae TaxID=3075532 RepID=A0ABU2S262_9ACTN|nr:CBS domain-containing protein [Streptomyces sp. DSM 41886]MDT0443052.1 CBS domain-containing protein [Streptomyces sp. DSM 41886]
MAQQIRDIMTADPVEVAPHVPVVDVAQRMRDEDIGAVLVIEDGYLRGLVTDRDLVVRVLAEGDGVGGRTVGEACSEDLLTVAPDDDVSRVITLARHRAVRRLPVVENNQPVGIVSLGDLAVERDTDSALADISAADPNE